ncbi:hypothetical protein TSAR_001798 [Trichomalopsis sarcophagae]|uniref:Uncharacterized protein n=1 Tax=Trichomalopsis sarcophagae TaxID=543379 RepID=A0A232F418_9HYME|nr:hypothetical protein TSAR_001798 [Trichomalopsis sarcophagae]
MSNGLLEKMTIHSFRCKLSIIV